MGLFDWLNIKGPFDWLNLIGAGLGAIGQKQATDEATAANQNVANQAGWMLNQGPVGYFGLTDQGTPQFAYDTVEDIRNTTGNMLRQYNNQYNNLLGGLDTYQGGINTLNRDYLSGVNSLYGNMYGNLLGQFDTGANQLLRSAQDRYGLLDEYAHGAYGQVADAAQKRLDSAMGIIENAGAQERKDINQTYDASKNAALMDLSSRGFRSGSLASGVEAQNARERSDTLGRLNDRLTQQRSDVYGAVSGDLLNLQNANANNMVGLRQALSGDVFNTQAQNFANRTNLLGGLEQGRFNLGSANAGLLRDTGAEMFGNRYNLLGQHEANWTNTYNAGQQALLGNNQANWANAYNLVTGINNAYPDSASYYNLMQGLGSGMAINQQNQALASQLRDQQGFKGLFGAGSGGVLGGGTTLGPLFALGGMAAGDYTNAFGNYLLGSVISDRNLKTDVRDVDAQEILASVRSIPVKRWRYQFDPQAEHIGPMAQDFHAALPVGESDRTIDVVSALGALMASVQALAERLDNLERRLSN